MITLTYEYEYIVEIEPYANNALVNLHFNTEEGGVWLDEEDCATLLDELLPLRQELILGDPRALYLALTANQERLGIESYVKSLAIPLNLRNLTPALRSFVEFFEINPGLLEHVTKQSTDLAAPLLDVTQLFEQEKNRFLQKVLDDDPHVRIDLQNLLMKKGTI